MNIDEPVLIVPYDDQWPKLFEQEKYRLQQALNKQHIEFEHIGSTSVAGLSSKPIIDIMIGIESYPPSNELILQICSLGYLFHGEANVPGRLYFSRRNRCNFNLAVVLIHKEHWLTNIKFRNHLRDHPQTCQEYERIKNAAINSGARTLLSYSEFKKEFIARIIKNL